MPVTPFILIFGLFLLFVVGRQLINLTQPELTRPAVVVARRTSRSLHNHSGHHHHSTSHYITFEFGDGSREEFRVSGTDYGVIIEGDTGALVSQGTWFKGFDRAM